MHTHSSLTVNTSARGRTAPKRTRTARKEQKFSFQFENKVEILRKKFWESIKKQTCNYCKVKIQKNEKAPCTNLEEYFYFDQVGWDNGRTMGERSWDAPVFSSLHLTAVNWVHPPSIQSTHCVHVRV